MCQSRSGFHSSRSQPFFASTTSGAIAPVRLEATVQHLGDVAEPGGAARADEVLVAEAIEVLALRTSEVPRREDGVGLLDHRALHDGEGRGNVRSRLGHQAFCFA